MKTTNKNNNNNNNLLHVVPPRSCICSVLLLVTYATTLFLAFFMVETSGWMITAPVLSSSPSCFLLSSPLHPQRPHSHHHHERQLVICALSSISITSTSRRTPKLMQSNQLLTTSYLPLQQQQLVALGATTSSLASSSQQPEVDNNNNNKEDDDTDDDDDDDLLEKAEMLGRGSAKAKRGKRKSGNAMGTTTNVINSRPKMNLKPEEIYYEGPPAISETIIPTASILTVIGVIPAAAAWARQAWVRYKITTRRIRVNSGFQGKDMAEIIYPDIVEIRTVKRLFGDGDMVLLLRDGAKFEMRNIPNFDKTMEFILQQDIDPKVVTTYRMKGDVSTDTKE